MNYLENTITSDFTLAHAKQTLESLSHNLESALRRGDFADDLDKPMELKDALNAAILAVGEAEVILN